MEHLYSPLAIALLVTSLVQGASARQTQTACGKQLVSGRIFNGQDAKDGAWPWQVSVQKSGSHVCGGSLISENWVLSAVHCFTLPVVSSAYRVQLGEKRISNQTQSRTFSSVKQVILHPSYNASSLFADIALVELENPIEFTATMSPVCLLDSSVHMPAGKPCWVTGWGSILPEEGSPPTETLQELEVLTIDHMVCKDLFQKGSPQISGYDPIKDDMMCARPLEGYKGFAWGDSGGPLVCEEEGTWYLAGIVSWLRIKKVNGTTVADQNYPQVYNRPYAYNDWIQKNVPGVTFTATNFTLNGANPSTTVTPNSSGPSTTVTPNSSGPSATVPAVLLLPVLLSVTL